MRDLYRLCHPGWPDRPAHYYTAYPTLVVAAEGQIVGYTSFSIGNYTGLVMVSGQDLAVRPDAQGMGLGASLHEARLAIGRSVWARMFSGVTDPENKAMIRIFEACGYHACQPIPRYFPNGEDGLVFLGPIHD